MIILGNIMGLTGYSHSWTFMSVLLLLVQLLRLIQVVLQTGILMISEKLKADDADLDELKPGKQVNKKWT